MPILRSIKATLFFLLLFHITQHSYAQERVVFFGSSTIALWPNLETRFPQFEVINKGVSGSTYRSLNRRLKDQLEELRPDRVVLYSGDNDVSVLNARSARAIILDFNQVVESIRHYDQNIEIIVLSVKHSPLRRYASSKINTVNAGINRAAQADPFIHVVDTNALMDNHQGLYRDGLHLSSRGYDLWSGGLAVFLK
jgi:lysophospholipase L1-like esterase